MYAYIACFRLQCERDHHSKVNRLVNNMICNLRTVGYFGEKVSSLQLVTAWTGRAKLKLGKSLEVTPTS